MNRNHHLKDQFETTSRRNTESLVPAICGGEWQSVAISRDWWLLVVIGGEIESSEAICSGERRSMTVLACSCDESTMVIFLLQSITKAQDQF
jgi:hypothetical protein